MTIRKRAARVSAVAVALGLSLAGPQIAIAAADTTDDAVSAASEGNTPSAGPARRVGTPRAVTPDRSSTRRGAASAGSTPPAAVKRAARAASTRIALRTNTFPTAPEPSATTPATDPTPAAAAPTPALTALTASAVGSTSRKLPALQSVPSAMRASAVAGNPLDAVNSVVQSVFSTLANWLNDRPPTQLGTYLEGALLMLRRNFFDQNAIASPVQTSYDPTTRTAKILGSIGAEDPDGDPLTYTVVNGPAHGTVEISADGKYSYTPTNSFAGDDSFIVQITSDATGVNVLNPAGSHSTDVTILVGDNAPTDPFGNAKNIRDAALYLGGIPVKVAVAKRNPLTGSVAATLSIRASDDTQVTWLDDQGNTGQMSVADVAKQWASFENAGNVRMGVDFTLEDGTDATIILTSVDGSYRSDSDTYVYSGYLASDPADGAGVDSYYDVIGDSFKTGYQNFLQHYVNVPNFTGAGFVIKTGDIYADSYSISDYEAAMKGTDPGIVVTPGDPMPAARLWASGNTSTAVTAFLPFGNGVVMGTGNGEVKLWTGKGWTTLQGLGWGSPVNTLISYQDGFVVGLGNGAVEQWTSTQVSDVTDGLPASAFAAYPKGSESPAAEGAGNAFDGAPATKYLNYTGPGSGVTIDLGAGRESTVNGLGLTAADDSPGRDPSSYEVYGSADGTNFTLISAGELSAPASRGAAYSDVTFDNATAYRYYRVVFPTVSGPDGGIGCDTSCVQIADIRLPGLKPGWTELQGAGWGQPVSTMMPYKDGFVVGLGSGDTLGGVQQWTGTQWVELQGQGWGQAVSTMIPYGDGFVVGLGAGAQNHGAVEQWTGTAWQELQGPGWGSPVSSTMAYQNGFVVGLANGGIEQWTGSAWNELHDGAWQQEAASLIPYGDGFVVGLGDGNTHGAVEQWTGSQWIELQGQGWRQAASHLVQFGDGFVVGLGAGSSNSGAVEYWGHHAVDDVTDGFGRTFTTIPTTYRVGGKKYSPDGEDITKAFDGSTTTKYLNFAGPGSGAVIDLGVGNAYAVNGMELFAGNDYINRDPSSYELYGSTDGTNYTLVSSGQLTLPADRNSAYDPVTFANATAYRFYKLTFPTLHGTDGGTGCATACMQISEIELSGVPEKPSWQELQGIGWGSPVTSMISYQGGVLVGLANGAVEQWVVGQTDSGWQELATNRIPFDSANLQAAVDFAATGGQSIADGTFNPLDPIFSNPLLQPKCMTTSSCDGSFYSLNAYEAPGTLAGASKSFLLGAGGQTLDLSYDLGGAASGYVYVPAGLWAKLKPSNYSAAVLTSMTTGPSLTLNLGDAANTEFTSGPITIVGPDATLAYWPTPVGTFQVTGQLDAELKANLLLAEGFDKSALSANFYYTAGVLTSFNVAQSDGLQFGFDSYGPTLNYDDFKQITGVTITPTLTPTVTGSWGLFTPASAPIIGQLSLFKVSLGYTNPLSLQMMLSKDSPSDLRFLSSGTMLYTAAVLPEFTSKLTYEDTLDLYHYDSGNLLVTNV